jgi:hypothetical protein
MSTAATPLNAACSGAQLLRSALSKSGLPEDDERLDILNDVFLSITTTVGLLIDVPTLCESGST